MDATHSASVVLGFALLLAIPGAAIASAKGRNFLAWLLYGLLCWPVGLVHAIVLKPTDDVLISRGQHKRCIWCQSVIDKRAVFCPFCTRQVEP